ncbi:DNA-binding transcriptional LysR family regulator [Novosphingobium sp. PhB57]|jgi:DNA-binding transcriptional LysR family regulator|uniref:LysR family transcriptional regulator n=1 Tax=unclassified Novosphingobium TaxID=2644732 RepID=UPI001043A20A|nr:MULTISPECIES: LysR family transcriptional regulator [unclassified Novosphingobium]TCU62159.1 DNA-binding transcriptional LysR family regulator [Novosphingobium sp. PhB57]TDW62799.1 DNA-binding transcriptional LysR family regulator [Novosphingobium sp. PhB55]
MDRLKGIEVFVKAIRLGGLSAAARDLSMSPAMAAKHLNALEQRLGATLVNRTTRRLALTEVGAAYLDKAERVLAELEDADAEAMAQSAAVEGLLRVSGPAAFGSAYLARLVTEFHALYPAVTVELGLNDRVVDLLEERWDVAVRIGRLADSNLVARKLAPVRMAICAAPAYLARHGRPQSVEDLAGHECLGYTLGNETGATRWGFGRDGSRAVAVRGSLHANNGQVLAQAAEAGMGLVYGPRFFVDRAIAAGRLVELDLGAELLDLGAVHAVTHRTRRPAAKTRAWIDFLVERLPPMARDW